MIFIGQMLAADENFLIGKSDIDRVVRATGQQGFEGLENKIVAAMHLGIGSGVKPHCSEGGI